MIAQTSPRLQVVRTWQFAKMELHVLKRGFRHKEAVGILEKRLEFIAFEYRYAIEKSPQLQTRQSGLKKDIPANPIHGHWPAAV